MSTLRENKIRHDASEFFLVFSKSDVLLLKGEDLSFKIRFVVKLISFAMGLLAVERQTVFDSLHVSFHLCCYHSRARSENLFFFLRAGLQGFNYS